jgi:hypothetical protein
LVSRLRVRRIRVSIKHNSLYAPFGLSAWWWGAPKQLVQAHPPMSVMARAAANESSTNALFDA